MPRCLTALRHHWLLFRRFMIEKDRAMARRAHAAAERRAFFQLRKLDQAIADIEAANTLEAAR